MFSRLDPIKVNLFIEVSASAFFGMLFVSMSLYEISVAKLTPLQLILVGTTVEAAVFVFEVPTGVVADVFSRRLSIIIGYLIMGIGFLVEGLFPSFLPILFAQIVWGLGYTFTSGATEAWISDEIGEEKANQLFLRATRIGLLASLLGMGAAILIGRQNVALPILTGAAGIIITAIILIRIMPETGFKPIPVKNRNTWRQMGHTFKRGISTVRARPRLITILGVGLFHGLYSEGFDRLWVKHLLDTFDLPRVGGSNEILFFGILRATGTILSIFVLRFVEKVRGISKLRIIGQTMMLITGLISASIMGFAFSQILIMTLGLFLLIFVLRRVMLPLYTAWVNQKLDPGTRATVLSISGQVDAIGQIFGGPGVGVIAKMISVPAAITTSGLILSPALLLIGHANAQSQQRDETETSVPD